MPAVKTDDHHLTNPNVLRLRLLPDHIFNIINQLRITNQEVLARNEDLNKRLDLLEAKNSLLKEEVLLLRKDYTKASRRIDHLVAQTSLLKKELSSSKKTAKSAKRQAARIEKELDKAQEHLLVLKAQSKVDYTTSSSPSSMHPNHPILVNDRIRTGLKPGAQPFHEARTRIHHEPDSYKYLPAPECVQKNPDLFIREPSQDKVHNETDIEIREHTVGYVAQAYRNKETGSVVKSAFPKGLQNEENYGPLLMTLCFLLVNSCNISIDKVRNLIAWLTDGALKVSKGFISGLAKKFSEGTQDRLAQIKQNLLNGSFLGVDFTHVKVMGKRAYAVIWANARNVLVRFSWTKDAEALKADGILSDKEGEGYQGPVVGDHDKAFEGLIERKQECLVHIIRYLKKTLLFDPNARWADQMLSLIRTMIRMSELNKRQSAEKVLEYKISFRAILSEARAYYSHKLHSKNTIYHEGWKLYKRMNNKAIDYLLFLDVPEVPYHNNRCEKIARIIKRKHKNIDTFRAASSAGCYFDSVSVLETARLHHENLFDLTLSVFEKPFENVDESAADQPTI